MSNKQAALEMPAKAEIVVAPPPTPLMILQEGVKQGVNVETLTQLLGLQERYEASQARKAFDEAFAAFKAEAPKLERSKEVSFGSNKAAYKYTPLDVIANTLGPILAKHGLSYNWKQESTKESITVTCILRHTQGHAIENQLSAQSDPSGSKNAIQAIGSAVSYLRRYTLLGVLGMATSDEDNDGMAMGNAVDFVASIETASNLDELGRRYKEAQLAALNAQDPNAVKAFMAARKKREQELRG
jgi:hypothetical protein